MKRKTDYYLVRSDASVRWANEHIAKDLRELHERVIVHTIRKAKDDEEKTEILVEVPVAPKSRGVVTKADLKNAMGVWWVSARKLDNKQLMTVLTGGSL